MAILGLGFSFSSLYGVFLLGMGLLIVIADYPLAKRMIKMNHAYGVRFPQSFYSEENWYAINEYGGKVMMAWGAFLAVAGACLLFVSLEIWVGLLVFLAVMSTFLVPIVYMYRYAKNFKPRA